MPHNVNLFFNITLENVPSCTWTALWGSLEQKMTVRGERFSEQAVRRPPVTDWKDTSLWGCCNDSAQSETAMWSAFSHSVKDLLAKNTSVKHYRYCQIEWRSLKSNLSYVKTRLDKRKVKSISKRCGKCVNVPLKTEVDICCQYSSFWDICAASNCIWAASIFLTPASFILLQVLQRFSFFFISNIINVDSEPFNCSMKNMN